MRPICLSGCRSSAFFETSFGRIYDRDVRARRRAAGRRGHGVGRGGRRGEPLLQQGDHRNGWHIISEFLAPRVLGREFDHPREISRRCGASAAQHGEGRARDGGVGSPRAPRAAALARCSAARARPIAVRRVDRHSGFARRSRRDASSRARRRAISASRSRSSPVGTSAPVEAIRERSATCRSWSTPTPPTGGDAALLGALDAFDLMMIEQPLDYDDREDHAALQRR